MVKFFKENLYNKNGRFEGQRLNETWFRRRNLLDIWNEHKELFTNQEKLFCFMRDNNLNSCELTKTQEYPVCKTCGEKTDFISRVYGYKNFCCSACADKARVKTRKNYSDEKRKEIREKTKQTIIERYGYNGIQKKTMQTKLERYGDPYFSNREKYKETCLERYGVDNVGKVPEVREKTKKTCLERYGTEYTLQSEQIKEKIKETCLERYGTEYASSSPRFREKVTKTCLKKYGVEHSFQSDNYKQKAKETWLKKYGCHVTQSPIILERIKQTMLKKDENGLNGYDRIRQTNEKNGIWLPLSQYTDFRLYCRLVAMETRKHMKSLENYDKRGFAEDEYHCDHMYSKYQGFVDGILPVVIGSKINLKMIKSRDNLSKSRKCSITKEQLFEMFEQSLNF